MSPPKPRLIILSAPSGAGKTTLCERLLADFPQVVLSISTTTRAKRPNEQEGVHYHFVSAAAFDEKIARSEFAEWALVHGNRYGTELAVVEKNLQENKHVLFDIDVQGAMNLRKRYGKRALLIFVCPPSMDELKHRLERRAGDTPESIERRLRNAYNELGWSQRFDHQIVNDNLERAYKELAGIIRRECL